MQFWKLTSSTEHFAFNWVNKEQLEELTRAALTRWNTMLSDEDFDNDLKQDAGFAFQEISSKRNRRKASFTIDLQKLRKKHQKSLSKYLRIFS